MKSAVMALALLATCLGASAAQCNVSVSGSVLVLHELPELAASRAGIPAPLTGT